MEQFDQFDAEETPEKSKSEIKRELLALQDLGKTLVDLTEKQLEKIPLDEKIRDQVLAARSMQRGALKRQSQYIGKLLRSVDVSAIYKALDRLKNQDVERNAHFHRLEHLRDKLINNDQNAFTQLITEYPEADRQQLHQLIRSAQKEKELNKAPAAARALFKLLRDLADNKSDEALWSPLIGKH